MRSLHSKTPRREAYPDEVLAHRFRPYGDPGNPPPAPAPEDRVNLDVDDKHAEERGVNEKGKEGRKKRRQGEAAESPKKLKKAKWPLHRNWSPLTPLAPMIASLSLINLYQMRRVRE
jgi:hypothetical protein